MAASRFKAARFPPIRTRCPTLFTGWPRGVYFEAMKIPLRRGRLFSEADERLDTSQVAIVNQAFVEEFLPGQEAIGQRIRFFGFDDQPQFMEIVGVVANVRSIGLRRPSQSEVFASGFQHPGDLSSPTLAVRGPFSATRQIRAAVVSIDPNVPVEFQSVEAILAASVSREQFQTRLIALFAALALILSAIGIYGVQSPHGEPQGWGTGNPRGPGRPIAGNVIGLVLREAFSIAALGVGIGFAGSLLLTRTLASFLYGVSPTDPFVFLCVALLLIAVVAVGLPDSGAARFANRSDVGTTL